MPRLRWLALLVLVSGILPGNAAENPSTPERAPREAASAPESKALREAFQSQFDKDQLAEFKDRPTIKQLVEQMTPEQKQGARTSLAALEQTAATPADLEEIAQGYLMLDEHSPAAGRQAVRIATRLQQMKPRDSQGFTIAASGLYQMGDFPAATDWAKKALELNPDDHEARTVYMFSVGRSKQGDAGPPITEGPSSPSPGPAGFASQDWDVPIKDASPQALALMKQASSARHAGDMEQPLRLAKEAMRVDPGSVVVQRFYAVVEADHKKHVETLQYLRLSGEALDVGRGNDAVALAQKAYDLSGSPTVFKILELTRQRSDELTRQSVRSDLEKQKDPPAGRFPLLPVAASLGFAVAGYGIAKSKTTWSEQESDSPEYEDANSERIQHNRYRLKVAAVSVAVGLGIVYGLPRLARVGVPAALSLLRGGNASLQKTLASEAGSVFPEEQVAAQRATASVRALSAANPPTASRFFEGTKYSERVLSQMEGRDFHAFPEIVKSYASTGEVATIRGGDGMTRWMLRIPGSYQGREGVFEFIREPNGVITHRLFKPNQ